ncbi:MAG: type VI secretion system baseplate subunit TssK [Deltaproteobacteria bacterium]|jgi:type VI secretion system protein ImpJ|nr:type VI secretion system baseplate subunit TssK [Deltaproteobacteria bacterium]
MIRSPIIFWKEGRPLEPHHFQILEHGRHALRDWVMGSLFPWPWGFTSLSLDDEALGEGVLAVREMGLALPGGFRLTVPGNADVPPALIPPEAWDGEGRLTAFLAVPLFSSVGANASAAPWEISGARDAAARAAEAGRGGEPVRFLRGGGPGGEGPRPAEGTAAPAGRWHAPPGRLLAAAPEPSPVPDMLTGAGVAWVDTMGYAAEIMFGPESADARGRAMLPIARLRRADGRVSRTPFAPPSLRLYPDSPLRDAALDVLELLRAKGRELEEYKLSPSRERTGAPVPGEGAFAVALGIVLRHIARLHHLLGGSAAHPGAVQAALSELASELAIFTPDWRPPPIPPYDHADPAPSFLAARAAVAGLLESVNPGPDLTLVFRREGASFTCDLPRLPEGALGFWLAVRSGLNADEIKASVSLMARVATPERLATIVPMGLPGVGLVPVREGPAGMLRRADTVFFEIRRQDPLWEEALLACKVGVRWDEAPDKAQLMLVAERR